MMHVCSCNIIVSANGVYSNKADIQFHGTSGLLYYAENDKLADLKPGHEKC